MRGGPLLPAFSGGTYLCGTTLCLEVDRRYERDRGEERAGAGVDAAGVAVRRAPQAVPTTRAPRTRRAKTPEVDPAKNQLLVDAFADAIKQAAAQGGGPS